jgi:glycosyltransferase involved in cell wall biosynthesis
MHQDMILKSNIQNNRIKDYQFSIITPCFNSAQTIQHVFESLSALNNNNFEWVVINDASTDNTENFIDQFLSDASFDISYFGLEKNKMATYCYHLGIEQAVGKFLIFLDHDDQIKPYALDRFLEHWDSLPQSQRENIAGMIALCEDENGKIVGTKFPRSPDINSFFSLMFDEGVRGEKFFCYKTTVMKENNFQLVDRYVPESNVMWKISSKYNTLFFNEALRIYNQPQEEGSNLSNLSSFEYPLGFRLNYLDLLNDFVIPLRARPYLLLAFLFNFSVYSRASNVSLKACMIDLRSPLHQLLLFPIYMVAMMLHMFRIYPSK